MNKKINILIVEDEILIAMCIEQELEKIGYSICRRVTSGEEAVRIALQVVPDCILMDVRLAGEIDGIEAARLIQSHINIPIIFITGYPNEAIEKRVHALKPLGFFIKPIKYSTLQPLIDSIKCV